jgi:membrane fusion protein (multidrug efflux system)
MARWRMAAVVVVVLLAVGTIFWWRSRGHESTDDAQVDGRITQIAARVSGTVVKVSVDNNQAVGNGTVLVQLDPRDYQIAVDKARAELADAQATASAASTGVPIARIETGAGVTTAAGGVEQATASVGVAEHEVQVAQANLVTAQARLREREAAAAKAAHDVERLRPLAQKDEIPQQQLEATIAQADASRAAADAAKSDVIAAQSGITVAQARVAQARAGSSQARASLDTARTAPQQLQVTQARASAAQARVQQMQAALAQAEMNLQYTTIKAPSAGVVSRKAVEVGQVVQAGQPLMALVDLEHTWVVANFKETQLKSMQPGQRAEVEVDALGGKSFKGHIESIAAATGAKFSLLPPENATGNFVKVVQRIPVRIAIDAGEDPNHLLRPGMSVTPTVYVK